MLDIYAARLHARGLISPSMLDDMQVLLAQRLAAPHYHLSGAILDKKPTEACIEEPRNPHTCSSRCPCQQGST